MENEVKRTKRLSHHFKRKSHLLPGLPGQERGSEFCSYFHPWTPNNGIWQLAKEAEKNLLLPPCTGRTQGPAGGTVGPWLWCTQWTGRTRDAEISHSTGTVQANSWQVRRPSVVLGNKDMRNRNGWGGSLLFSCLFSFVLSHLYLF